MPHLHLPKASYNLFVYDFWYDFSGIVGGYKLRFTLFTTTLWFLLATDRDKTLQRPCGDCTETTRSSCSHHVIFTPSAQKSHDASAMSYDYLESLRLFFGPKWLSKTMCCPHNQRVMSVRGSCDLSAMTLWPTSLRFFKICHSEELSKIMEATMSLNPYHDRTVSLRRPHRKGYLDIANSSEGKCNRGITDRITSN